MLTPDTPSCCTGSSFITSGDHKAATGVGSHSPAPLRLFGHPAPVTDVNPARASFALSHTGNPRQAQELDPAHFSSSPELCDLWYCCNETCLSRSPLPGGEKLPLFYRCFNTKKPTRYLPITSTPLLSYFCTQELMYFLLLLHHALFCHVLFSLLYQ